LDKKEKKGAGKPRTHKEPVVSCRTVWHFAMPSCFYYRSIICLRLVSMPGILQAVAAGFVRRMSNGLRHKRIYKSWAFILQSPGICG